MDRTSCIVCGAWSKMKMGRPLFKKSIKSCEVIIVGHSTKSMKPHAGTLVSRPLLGTCKMRHASRHSRRVELTVGCVRLGVWGGVQLEIPQHKGSISSLEIS